MKFALLALIGCTVVVGCASEPVVRDGDLRILDKNVLGATYVVCGSTAKWDGVTFAIEGLNGEIATKKFTLGKLSYQPTQVREINTIALSIDALFRQMCQSTVALRNNPQALAAYVVNRDDTALKLFGLLQQMETINLSGTDAESIINNQKKQFKDTTGGNK